MLSGSRYPRSVLSAIVMRLRADGEMTDLRAALCKGVLARDARLGSKDTNKRTTPVSLDTGNTDPGYLLGRLFSILENVQRAALGRRQRDDSRPLLRCRVGNACERISGAAANGAESL